MEMIEFYKNRSLGERFSAAAEFLRQNWKVLYKIILIPAIPLAIVMGYFQQTFVSGYTAILQRVIADKDITAFNDMFSSAGTWIYYIVYLVFVVSLSAMAAAVMSRYQAGALSKDTSLKDLGSQILSNMGKLFLIGLCVIVIAVLALIIIGILIGVLASSIPGGVVLAVFIAFAAFFAIIPPLYLVRFPALFQNASVGTSIKKGFILGFKNWGSTFAMIIVLGVATVVISFVFGLPYTIWTLTHLGQSDAVSYILGGISSLSEAFVTPLVFVFLAFQYFSIAEKEEGISLQSKVEEFDNL